ncbi:MAG: NADH-quinone oxidoreductase subunit C [Gammaproteobacteria bacterium]|nr:NADH-quinone oxidoreductase subunit C [Gammaproteobacteria bacterium]
MIESLDELSVRLRRALGERIAAEQAHAGQLCIELRPEQLLAACQILRDDAALAFAQLTDLCGIDYSTYGDADWTTAAASGTGFSRGVSRGTVAAPRPARPRFAVVYHLLSIEHNIRLRVRAPLADEQVPRVPSVTEIWPGANWFEREAFDMFGILFDGHPDLRRLLTDYGFVGHAFRKDFPLEGHVEVRYDPEQRRVIYQPVSIENRVLVPRVIRDEQQQGAAAPQQTGAPGA